MTTAWFHCFNGVAGDMALGALLHAGAEESEVRALLGRLPVTGWELTVAPVQRNGIAALHARVTTVETQTHRTVSDLERLLDEAALPARVGARARAVFRALGDVEGAVHGQAPGDVELHEVGALDALVDVVGTCAALEVLGVDDVVCSPIATGLGTVRGAHGVLSNPAPAVVALLARAGAPARGVDVPVELATPTGVALMTVLSSGFGPLPPMRPAAVGHGAGTRELEGRPNVVQVVVGEPTSAGRAPGPGQPVRLFEANVDDATGEVLAHTVAALLAAGALDAWVTPIVMKKGRPAHVVSALAGDGCADTVATTLVRETGTLGLRASTVERWPQARDERTIDVGGHPVRVKVTADRVKVEHDDALAAARALDRPLRDVLSAAEAAGRDTSAGTPS
jgi:uncharacterized protein (TIGR00299 family) protein